MQTVLPEAASCRMRSRTRRTHCRSTPEAGSSRRRTSAPVAMSRARATSFCSPKASDEAISPALSASPTKAREPRAWSRFRRSASAVRRGAKKSGPGAPWPASPRGVLGDEPLRAEPHEQHEEKAEHQVPDGVDDVLPGLEEAQDLREPDEENRPN